MEELAAEVLGIDESPPSPAVTLTVVVVLEFKKKIVSELKDIAALVNVAQGRAKRALFDRIATSGSGVERVNQNTFKYSRLAVEGETGDVGEVIKPPLCVELQGQFATSVHGINMTTGAPFGFYGPTNKENAMGAVRNNYLVRESIYRPDLDRKVFGPPYPPPRYDGHTSYAAKELIGDVRLAWPKDFFDLQLKPELFSFFRDATNLRAAADGAGSGLGTYYDFVPFDVAEIHCWRLVCKGLTPKPRLEY